jgi:hypothetical protein
MTAKREPRQIEVELRPEPRKPIAKPVLDSPPAEAIITYDEYAKLRADVVTSVRGLTIATDDLREAVEKLRAEVEKLQGQSVVNV